MRNSYKFARDWHAKLPALAGNNSCNLQAKVPAIAFKNTPNRRKKYRQKYRQLQTKITAIAGKNRFGRQSATTPRVKSPAKIR